MKGVCFMANYIVDLSKCSDSDREKYEHIISLGFDAYLIAGRPFCYEVIWDNKEPLTDLVPPEFVQTQQNS
jgi:hypothetical protein